MISTKTLISRIEKALEKNHCKAVISLVDNTLWIQGSIITGDYDLTIYSKVSEAVNEIVDDYIKFEATAKLDVLDDIYYRISTEPILGAISYVSKNFSGKKVYVGYWSTKLMKFISSELLTELGVTVAELDERTRKNMLSSVTISDMLSAVSEDMLTSLEKENVRTAVKTSDTIAEVLINSELYKVLAGVGVITLKNHNVSGVLELNEVLELIAAKKNSDLLFVPIKDDTFLVDTIGAIWRYGLNPNKYTIAQLREALYKLLYTYKPESKDTIYRYSRSKKKLIAL